MDQRFADLKQSLIKPENKQKVIESYARLVKVLKAEVDHIAKFGPALVPEIDFNEIRKNSTLAFCQRFKPRTDNCQVVFCHLILLAAYTSAAVLFFVM